MAKHKSTQTKGQHDRRWDLPAGSVVWVYLRHSPGDAQTIDSQREGMQTWCAERGWTIDRYWVDEGISGSREDCDEFQAMLSAARQIPRQVDGILVWSFSRFARSQLDAQFYKADLRKRGYVVQSKIDDVPDNEMATIYEAFIDWKNERFLKDLSADIRRGKSYTVRSGAWVNGKVAIGYRKEPFELGIRRNGHPRYGFHLVKDEATRERVALAWKMKLEQNASYLEIHRATRLFSGTNKYCGFFDNLIYVGILVYAGEWLPADWEQGARFCESYVTLEEFNQVQQNRVYRSHMSPRVLSSSFLLSGLLKCGLCFDEGRMSPMTGIDPKDRSYRVYRCSHRMRNADDCSMQSFRTNMVDGVVLQLMRDQVLTSAFFQEAFEQIQQTTVDEQSFLQERYRQAEEGVQEARQGLDGVVMLIAKKGMNDILERRYDEAERVWQSATRHLNQVRTQLQNQTSEVLSFADFRARLDGWVESLVGPSLSDQQAFLRSYVEMILLYPDRMDVRLRFAPDTHSPSARLPVLFEPLRFIGGSVKNLEPANIGSY